MQQASRGKSAPEYLEMAAPPLMRSKRSAWRMATFRAIGAQLLKALRTPFATDRKACDQPYSSTPLKIS
jgi:hypothetical protein